MERSDDGEQEGGLSGRQRQVETESVACALCGRTDPRPLFRSRDLRFDATPRDEFTLVECPGCGLRYLNPRPAGAALTAFYPRTYYSHRPGSPARRGLLRQIYPSRADRILREKVGRARRLLPANGRFIEYGPSAGQFLAALAARGFRGVGIERDEEMVRHVRERLGLPCFLPEEFDSEAHGPVDLVALWNVFEHLPDPAGFVRWARRLLPSGGHLLLSVPNATAIERPLFFRGDPCEDIPRHLYAYTPRTIRAMLEKEGFAVVAIDQVSRVATSELQERAAREIFRNPRASLLKKVLYTALLLPLFWMWDRLTALLGRSHTMVVTARRAGEV